MPGISVTTSYNSAAADGSTTVFNFTFFSYSTDTIKVYSVDGDNDPVPITTGITKVLNSSNIGGTVTFSVAPLAAVGDILIRREVPYTQEKTFSDLTRYKETAIEQALNTLALEIQQVAGEVALSLRYSETASTSKRLVGAPVDGAAMVFDGVLGNIKAGPSTTEISNAQGYALAAASSASSALSSANAAAASAAAAASGQGPWFTPTTIGPSLASVARGLYRSATDVVGIAARSAAVMLFSASAAGADNYLQLQVSDSSAYGPSTHGDLKFEAKGAATSIRMDFMTKHDSANNYGSSGFAFYDGPNRLLMRLEPTGVNYTGALDRHLHIEPGYSGTSQYPSIRSMANDGYIGPGGSGTTNNVTALDISMGIGAAGRGYVGLFTRAGNRDTAVGGGVGTGGGVDVLQGMFSDTAAANTFVQITGGAAGADAKIYASSGYVTNVGMTFGTQNGGAYTFQGDAPVYADSGSTPRTMFRIGYVASSVNYHRFQPSSAGNPVYDQPDGTDTNISRIFGTKGTGGFFFQSGDGSRAQLVIVDGNGYNYLYIKSGAAGQPAEIGYYPVGDTDKDLALYTAGTGVLRSGTRSVIGVKLVTHYMPWKLADGTAVNVALVS